jgi:chitinase
MKLLPCFFRCWFCLLFLLSGCQTADSGRVFDHDGRRVIAYWHNWQSRTVPYLPLAEVPGEVNTLIVAFALPTSGNSGNMSFVPEGLTPDEFKLAMGQLQLRGVDVLISVGGGNHPIELKSEAMKRRFVASLGDIVDEYGFDGIDINLEGASKVLDAGDTDFRHPATPKVLYMIEAVRELKARYRNGFLITVAPETQYAVSGYNRYGEGFGGYLPFLHALRDEIDVVHMQFYNSGSQFVYPGDVIVEQGTPDFVVGLAEMLIMGFPVGRDEKAYFPGLGAEKIAVGLPANKNSASGGALNEEQFRQAMGYLMTGKADYPTQLRLREPGGYPGLKGVMTWSINWDALGQDGHVPFSFVRHSAATLRELVPLQ